jgi:hypothetical protein
VYNKNRTIPERAALYAGIKDINEIKGNNSILDINGIVDLGAGIDRRPVS